MSVRGNAENCVEESVAPEWLSKLERRRENLQRATKLSHEVGAGAPCVECGEKCPGLDLHYWRKVCRNCKCRKDQHKCSDEDLSSCGQFEILGQICSKPAFIKIKALASQPVQLEWVPPNTTPDVVSEYMEKLGTAKMPITGSEAAQKRKQQLEFQVPPHDLNAELCDNLTDAEANQLQQYVVKIRDNCVGQGIVVRVGNVGIGFVDFVPSQKLPFANTYNSPSSKAPSIMHAGVSESSGLPFHSPLPLKTPISARFGTRVHQESPMRKLKFGSVVDIADVCGIPSSIDYEKDPIFGQILRSEQLKLALNNLHTGLPVKPVVISQVKMQPDFSNAANLGIAAKKKLNELEMCSMAVQSALLNGSNYDMLLTMLKNNDLKFDCCRLLAPINKLREELQLNQRLSEELHRYVAQLPNSSAIMYSAPMKTDLKESISIDSGLGSKASTPICNMSEIVPGILPSALHQLKITGSNNIDLQQSAAAIKCRDCDKPIYFGDIAVRAERAGKHIAWHPECFKCFTCRELLADLVYFFHDGQVYCGRDLAINLKIPRCKACDELIFTKEYTAAEGATFHIKHFCCYHCDTPLAGHQYVPDEKTNMPLCLTCFSHYFAAVCEKCDRPIQPTDQGIVWGDIHWHSGCFTCAGVNCGNSLIGGRFCVKQRMPFCSPKCVRSII